MVKSGLPLFACLLLLARAQSPVQQSSSEPQYFGSAFFRSMFGWQTTGGFKDCIGIFLPSMRYMAEIWYFWIGPVAYGHLFGFALVYVFALQYLYHDFLIQAVRSYREQRCYFFSTTSELVFMTTLVHKYFYVENPKDDTFKDVVLGLLSPIVRSFYFGAISLNAVSFVVDLEQWLNNGNSVLLGYLVGDFVKFVIIGFENLSIMYQ